MNDKWKKMTRRGGVVILSAAVLTHSMETEEHDWLIDMNKYHFHQENYEPLAFTRVTMVNTSTAQYSTTTTTT
jgi:hypothetical protein